MIWEPFDDQSRNIIKDAQKYALRIGNNYIGTEHILVSIIINDEYLRNVLKDQDIEIYDIIKEVENINIFYNIDIDIDIDKGIVFTNRMKKIIEISVYKTRDRKGYGISPKDIFDAILEENKSTGYKILMNLGFRR